MASLQPMEPRVESVARPLRIAMIGQKGLPATYGGIEHHVEEVGSRLAARGHHVEVFCRPSYTESRDEQLYRGMHLRTVWTVGTKHLDAIGHSVVSSCYSAVSRPDIVHYHALGPMLASPIIKGLSSSRVVVTVHGLDHERDKWGRAGRAALGLGHWMSARVADATVVVSHDLERHYAERFDRRCFYIPNGVDAAVPRVAEEIRRRWHLEPRRYALFVGRLVPEKCVDLLIRAYRAVPGDLPLVIAGDSSFTDAYVSAVRAQAAADPRVVLCGYVYGTALQELYSNAAVFVQPSRLEGMPLTLLEAASYGTPVVASDIAPHREVVGTLPGCARLVRPDDESGLARALTDALAHPDRSGAQALRRHVLDTFRWDAAVAELEQVYLRLADSSS